tara:strand:- start:10939 stop:11190 length:252 start_codon:yes stop_codon:yes gene_type:complete
MAKLERNQTVYYKDWTDGDKIYPAKVIHCKYRYVIIDVLVKGLNIWETWEVNISDCKPTEDFEIIRPVGSLLGDMIQYKEGVK